MMRVVTLEAGLIVGGELLLFGLALSIYAVGAWGSMGFGMQSPERTMRLVIPSGMGILLGFQVAVLEIRTSRAVSRWEAEF